MKKYLRILVAYSEMSSYDDTKRRVFDRIAEEEGALWYEDATYSSDYQDDGMLLRSGRRSLRLKKEKVEVAIEGRSFDYESESDENNDDVHYSAFDLFDPVVYERVRVEPYEDYEYEDEEYMTDEFREFLEERRDVERIFDFAEIRNKLRGYVCDSYKYGYLERHQLLDIIEHFNDSIESIRERDFYLSEYERICRKRLRTILIFALNREVISWRSLNDVTLRLRKMRGKNNNTFRRNKEEYFGDCGSESETETTIEETSETKVETTYH